MNDFAIMPVLGVVRSLKTTFRLSVVAIFTISFSVMGHLPALSWELAQVPTHQVANNQKNQTKILTQLELRFEALGVDPASIRREKLSREEAFRRKAEAIQNSDPLEDARADIAAGHIGFMTLRQLPRGGGRRHAPGVFCGRNFSENGVIVSKHNVLTLDHTDLLRKNELQAVRTFEKYASNYNKYVLSNSNIRNENCSTKSR